MLRKAKTQVRDHVRFLGALVDQPASTGAIAPSSPALAEEMVSGLGLDRAGVIAEFGPGTGSITKAIARHARADATVVLMEIHSGFAEEMRKQYPNFHVVNDSAENLRRHLAPLGCTHTDCIVSGLPFAAFPGALQEALLCEAAAALRPGGWFSTFTYVHARYLPPGRRFFEKLLARFGEVEVSPVVWKNLPPAVVYRVQR